MPLYEEIVLRKKDLLQVFQLLTYTQTIDAYCIYCKREGVFKNCENPAWRYMNFEQYAASPFEKYTTTAYVCTRHSSHKYISHFRLCDNKIAKVGQYPSTADLQIPQAQKYHKLLGGERYKEFTRAIGLAAHGVGIGSFVYLRRIFEGLIEEAHVRASEDTTFDDATYKKSRIEQKIMMLKGFLPSFLVNNRSIYTILSKGVHELKENECLAYFDTMKVGIELILDERIRELHRKLKEKQASETIGKIVGELNTNDSD